MKTILLTILLTISSYGMEAKLSAYCTPDDSSDDSSCFQNAISDLKTAGGGTLLVDAGTWNVNNQIDMSSDYASFVIQGTKQSIIIPSMGSGQTLFSLGNTNQVALRDLIILGNPDVDFDAGFIVIAGSNMQLTISGCQFFGLRTNYYMIYVNNTDTVIENSQFDGNSAIATVYGGPDLRSMKITNTTFIDYANFKGTYISKTASGNGAWIRLKPDVPGTGAGTQRRIELKDLRLDEGATYGIEVSNVRYLSMTGLNVNVSNMSDSAGIKLNNVRLAYLNMSNFGFASNARPAILASNSTTVRSEGVTLAASVFGFTKDATSVVVFSEFDSPNISRQKAVSELPIKKAN